MLAAQVSLRWQLTTYGWNAAKFGFDVIIITEINVVAARYRSRREARARAGSLPLICSESRGGV